MTLTQVDLNYFALGKHENPKFLGRLGAPNFAQFKPLEEYFSHNIYCVLEKCVENFDERCDPRCNEPCDTAHVIREQVTA